MAVVDFYKVLRIQRTATQKEIKDAYRKMAMKLHPDKHDGCEVKSGEFKQITEAYQILSDKTKRNAHDKVLNGYSRNSSNSFSGPMPNYRKVYAPHQPPPGFKTFDAKKHYDMHYGDGMMKEEIERARKRAERAGGRGTGYEYQSPLGEGFDYTAGASNPFRSSRRDNKKRYRAPNGGGGSEDIEYEEGYMDVGSGEYSSAKSQFRGREIVSERMKQRRKMRRRNRDDPMNGDVRDESCTIM